MKFTGVASLLCLSGALASSSPDMLESRGSNELVARAGSNVVMDSLYAISNATDNLNNNITVFSVDTILQLQVVSASVVQTINAANGAVKNSAMLDSDQALALQPVLMQLVNLVNKTVANVIDHKEAFGGVAPVVLSNIQQQQTATTAFTATVAGKLPTNFVKLSYQLSQPIFDSLDMGAEVFATPNVNPSSEYVLNAAASSRPGLGLLAIGFVVAVAIFSGADL